MKQFFIVEPLVDPVSMRLRGVEILTRFQDQYGKFYPPDTVIQSMSNEERCLLLREQVTAIKEKMISSQRTICCVVLMLTGI